MNKFLVFIALIISQTVMCQDSEVLNRLQALENNGKIWYNTDGYSISSENFEYRFDEKGIKKVLRKLDIKDDSRVKDSDVRMNNIHFYISEAVADGLTVKNTFYIVENANKQITAVRFSKVNDNDVAIQKEVTNLIVKNKIPRKNYANMKFGKINFGGREIDLGNSCYWTSLNSVQCPYMGQMNYSVHKELQDAKNSVDNQLKITKSSSKGKVVLEEIVDVEFENVPTKAVKIVYDLTGITGIMAGTSGGKTLTAYYVAENVRGNAISCVMSFWNNDEINPETKLPPLLEKVMKLK